MRLKEQWKPILLLFLPLLFSLFFLKKVWGESQGLITASIKLSICGNGIIEGGEDCEGNDLNGQNCESLGYGPGVLKCDIACSFDTSNCSPAPTPTPTLTLTPTPINTPTPVFLSKATTTPTSAPAATSAPGAAATNTPTPTPPAPTLTPVLPAVVAAFDINQSGRIEVTEVFVVVKTWVEEWREALSKEISDLSSATTLKKESLKEVEKCDLNRDSRCDLIDLSILLYYVGR